MGYLTIVFLGTGTSQGVPVIGCDCEVCLSNDSKDKRLRSSILITSDKGTQITIDAGPDFRTQMLNERVKYLDAILVTHAHRDHVSGLDDVRSYNYLQQSPMPIFGNRCRKANHNKNQRIRHNPNRSDALQTPNLSI